MRDSKAALSPETVTSHMCSSHQTSMNAPRVTASVPMASASTSSVLSIAPATQVSRALLMARTAWVRLCHLYDALCNFLHNTALPSLISKLLYVPAPNSAQAHQPGSPLVCPEDINEYQVQNRGCEVQCTNVKGSFRCSF